MEMSIAEEKQQSNAVPMIIVAGLFFILGFATWLNGSLMPYLKQILQLTPFEASLIIFSFYIAITFTALPSAIVIRKVGYKNSMALGMGTMMVAGLLFIPAAKVESLYQLVIQKILRYLNTKNHEVIELVSQKSRSLPQISLFE
jgi:fucose permease